MTQQQKKRREELDKEDKTHELKEPNNKKLLENWFDLNDSVVKAMDARKITSKYEGSESGYILFYRRKGVGVKNKM